MAFVATSTALAMTAVLLLLSSTSRGPFHSTVSRPDTQQEVAALSSKDRGELRKVLQAYLRESDSSVRERLFLELFSRGRAGVEYLETLGDRKDAAEVVARVRRRSRELLGIDLIEAKLGKLPDWSPSTFRAGEIVLVRKDDRLAGFSVGPAELDGAVRVQWWSSSDGKRLGGSSGESGALEVTGKPSTVVMQPNSGWTELDFSFQIAGMPVTAHAINQAYFRFQFGDAGVSFALTGALEPRKLPAVSDVLFQDRYPAALARVSVALQQYLFRIVPGCEALELPPEERASFAQYEAVQILVRQTRPEGDPIVLVRFLEPERVRFEPIHEAMMRAFVAECLPAASDHVIVMGGGSLCPESNRFFLDGQWRKPPSKLIELLRKNLPELC